MTSLQSAHVLISVLFPVKFRFALIECALRNGFNWESFTVHDHYIWNSARPRTEQRTVEMRPACQQPWEEHMVVSALCLGLVEATSAVLQVWQDACAFRRKVYPSLACFVGS